MSFILDALKKIERQQRDHGAAGKDRTLMAGGRRWADGDRTVKVAFVLLGVVSLVALTLAAVALVFGLKGTPRVVPRSLPGAAERAAPAPSRASEDAPKELEEPRSRNPSAGVSSPQPAREPRRARERAPTDGPMSAEPDPALEPASAPLVRLVGRGSESVPDTESPTTDSISSELPADAASLVLQGTSVIEGRPVAVINYQRVFVGDVIDGATVIRISDRAVELELNGRRFTLHL